MCMYVATYIWKNVITDEFHIGPITVRLVCIRHRIASISSDLKTDWYRKSIPLCTLQYIFFPRQQEQREREREQLSFESHLHVTIAGTPHFAVLSLFKSKQTQFPSFSSDVLNNETSSFARKAFLVFMLGIF